MNLRNLYNALSLLEKDKSFFLGEKYTFNSLESFIRGFETAATEKQFQSRNMPDFKYFSEWLIGHLDKSVDPDLDWGDLIHERNPHDDEKAIEEFFHFLHIFKRSGLAIKALTIDHRTRRLFLKDLAQVNGSKPSTYPFGDFTLYWTQIENSTSVWIQRLDKYMDEIDYVWYINAEKAISALKGELGDSFNDWMDLKLFRN